MKKFLSIISILLLVGCSSKITYKTISTKETFNEITKTKIIDVRSEAEYNSGHIESSVNIPLDKIETINLTVKRKITVHTTDTSINKVTVLPIASLVCLCLFAPTE